MRKLHSKVAIGLGIAVLSLAVIGAEQQRPTQASRLIRLKSNGQTVAELRILGSSPGTISVHGKSTSITDGTHTVIGGTNGVTIRIGSSGQHPVTITAQEAEVLDDPK